MNMRSISTVSSKRKQESQELHLMVIRLPSSEPDECRGAFQSLERFFLIAAVDADEHLCIPEVHPTLDVGSPWTNPIRGSFILRMRISAISSFI